ncbi:unnamed protein product [Cyprideis torosa]|uniref:Uncharacterized protein n=1 Tax=Cyprideis torosa TaxID=163714 RepID=A0A7R8WJN3_9CRUS|nr:unnamed protein product [Cyprideis torosa]CAG0902227.1 unnamed protein product [Cyprideis torosa]
MRLVGKPVKGTTPLMLAVIQGHYSVALWLLREFGADVNAQDFESRSALHHACLVGRPRIARLLLRKGALVEARDRGGRTPLFASVTGHPITLRLLHRFGANPAATDADDWTPLHFATDRGHTSSVACLLEMGAPVEAEEKKWKARPLHLACDKGHFPCVRLLVNAGADVNARTANGKTPFLIAAQLNHVEILRLLAHSGADISLPNGE